MSQALDIHLTTFNYEEYSSRTDRLGKKAPSLNYSPYLKAHFKNTTELDNVEYIVRYT